MSRMRRRMLRGVAALAERMRPRRVVRLCSLEGLGEGGGGGEREGAVGGCGSVDAMLGRCWCGWCVFTVEVVVLGFAVRFASSSLTSSSSSSSSYSSVSAPVEVVVVVVVYGMGERRARGVLFSALLTPAGVGIGVGVASKRNDLSSPLSRASPSASVSAAATALSLGLFPSSSPTRSSKPESTSSSSFPGAVTRFFSPLLSRPWPWPPNTTASRSLQR
ncbi:hypothetical protein IWZ01DRAFT_370113 [Phyllosticta capitalensis]